MKEQPVSDDVLVAVMIQRATDRACEGGDENEDQRHSSESCHEFYGVSRLEQWCDMCLFDVAIKAIQGDAQVASQSPAPPIGTTNHVVGPFDTRGLIATSPPRAQEWQPIETAPKDGTRVKLKRVYERALIAEGFGYFGTVTIYYGGGPYMALDGLAYADPSERTYTDVWIVADGTRLFPEPTHWMIRDAPPSDAPP